MKWLLRDWRLKKRIRSITVLLTKTGNKLTKTFSFSYNKEIVSLWHSKLGHISFRKLSYMSILKDFKFNKGSCSLPCDNCPHAKQHRLPFHSSYVSSTKPFEIIHVDTWGPYHTKTTNGQRCFLILVMITQDQLRHI